MTFEQINQVIADVNLKIDDPAYQLSVAPSWLFDTDESGTFISAIILSSNESIYPDKTIEIQFDNDNEMLLLKRRNDTDEEITYISYGLIIGITMLRRATRKSPYSVGKSV
jgi:hypothetical protein